MSVVLANSLQWVQNNCIPFIYDLKHDTRVIFYYKTLKRLSSYSDNVTFSPTKLSERRVSLDLQHKYKKVPEEAILPLLYQHTEQKCSISRLLCPLAIYGIHSLTHLNLWSPIASVLTC